MLWLWRNFRHQVRKYLGGVGDFQGGEYCGDWSRIRDRDRFQLPAASSGNLGQERCAGTNHPSGQHLSSGEAMSATAAQRFLQDAAVKSADLVHRGIILHGLESYDAAHLRGRTRFKDWEAARQR